MMFIHLTYTMHQNISLTGGEKNDNVHNWSWQRYKSGDDNTELSRASVNSHKDDAQ